MKVTYCINTALNGIEITFEGKPTDEVREEIKQAGYRWHRQKKIWYAKATPEREGIAKKLAYQTIEPAKSEPEKPKNKFGVVVGDIFSASWGYEQTNVDFFQVIALVGKESVRVREVNPPMISEDPVSGMPADRTYKISRDILPAAKFSTFIKDQDKGDLKRLKSYAADGVSNPQFYLTSYANAHYCNPGKMKTYESWYY